MSILDSPVSSIINDMKANAVGVYALMVNAIYLVIVVGMVYGIYRLVRWVLSLKL